MISEETKKQIIEMIQEETGRIQYGKILIEITVTKSKCTNVQAETKRSLNLNETPPTPTHSMSRFGKKAE